MLPSRVSRKSFSGNNDLQWPTRRRATGLRVATPRPRTQAATQYIMAARLGPNPAGTITLTLPRRDPPAASTTANEAVLPLVPPLFGVSAIQPLALGFGVGDGYRRGPPHDLRVLQRTCDVSHVSRCEASQGDDAISREELEIWEPLHPANPRTDDVDVLLPVHEKQKDAG